MAQPGPTPSERPAAGTNPVPPPSPAPAGPVTADALERMWVEVQDELISTLLYMLGNPEDAKDAGQNLRAAIGVWQWTKAGNEQVYPPSLATAQPGMVPLPPWNKR